VENVFEKKSSKFNLNWPSYECYGKNIFGVFFMPPSFQVFGICSVYILRVAIDTTLEGDSEEHLGNMFNYPITLFLSQLSHFHQF
jgi:hypothetical protein